MSKPPDPVIAARATEYSVLLLTRAAIRFFYSWFHCFDALIIALSFVIDVLAHGVVEEIASLVIILRLWRLVKMVEELGVGAEETTEELQTMLDEAIREKAALEKEKEALEARLTTYEGPR